MSEKEKTIRKWVASEEYKANHDRIFKKKEEVDRGMFIHLELDDLEEFLKRFFTDHPKQDV